MLFGGLSAEEVSDVYRRYGAMLVRRCRVLTRDAALGEDAVQELLAVLLRRGRGLRSAESPYRWLCRAADRACLDLLRRRRHVSRALRLDDCDDIGVAPSIDADARLTALEALGDLDDDQQTLAILLFVDGLSQGEAAKELGVSRVTVNKRAQLVRAKLRLGDAPEERTT